MRARLKLFVADDKQQRRESSPSEAAIPLEDFARVIADAVSWERTWLQDFAQEQIIVSQDLYEIVRVYDDVHRVGA